MNSWPIFTPPCPTLALAFNIYTLLTSSPSPQGSIFINHIELSCTSQLTHPIFFPNMVFECRNNIRNQPVSTTISSPNSFRNITTIGTHQHLGKVLKEIFFGTVWHLDRHSTQANIILSSLSIDFHSYTQELVCMFSSDKFFLFITQLRILSLSQVGFTLHPYRSSST